MSQAPPTLASLAVDEVGAQPASVPAGEGRKRKRAEEDTGGGEHALKQFRDDERQMINEYYADKKRKEKLECVKIKLNILAWTSRFPEVLKDTVKNVPWDSMDLSEHLSLLDRVKFVVANRGAGVLEEEAAEMILGFAQKGLVIAGFEVNGPEHYLTDLAKDPSFKDTVAEVQLEYMQIMYLNPLPRLLAQLGHGVITIHEANKLSTAARSDAVLAYGREHERQQNLQQSVENLQQTNPK